MDRTRVTSSNIESIGYDKATQTLEIAFLNGGIYQYDAVPSSVYDGLLATSSHGGFFDSFVKKAGYRYRRV